MSRLLDATAVECPTCCAWIGWACNGHDYGYHAAGYHPARERAAALAAGFHVSNDKTLWSPSGKRRRIPSKDIRG